MSNIILIGCSKRKNDFPMQAQNMYKGELFKLSLVYARILMPDETFILSAKYGLLTLEEEIMPYDKSLHDMSWLERLAWGKKVGKQLGEVTDLQHDHYTFLAGIKYREHLIPLMKQYDIPLKGLGIGEQLSFLKKILNTKER